MQMLTAEPFDMPYYLSRAGIDFAKITPFELFCYLSRGLPRESTKLLLGNLNLSDFKITCRNGETLLMDSNGIMINSLTREILADNIRRMHSLPKNIITSCENDFTHDLLIQQQKKEIDRAERRRKMFGENSNYAAFISSLACEWQNYDQVLDMTVGRFFDALVRLGYKVTSQNLYMGIYSGNLSPKDINKKDLDWMRPIKNKTL